MLALRIQEFINSLVKDEELLDSDDLEFLGNLQARFSLPHPNDLLNERDLLWLENIFAQRWAQIADTSKDYTFNSCGINSHWIVLAIDLAPELKKKPAQLLIPTLVNDKEPNLGTDLKDIDDLCLIYLGDDNQTWYSLKALLQQLKWQPANYLFKDRFKEKPPVFLSLNELFRIRSKTGIELIFEGGGQKTSFWSYFVQKFASVGQKQEEIPILPLVSLVELVETYLEPKDKPFSFQQRFLQFTQSLKSYSAADINYLYLMPIMVQGKAYYLFEILLDCMEESIDLKEKLLGLVVWVCQFAPFLYSDCQALIAIYKKTMMDPAFELSYLSKLVEDLDFAALKTKAAVKAKEKFLQCLAEAEGFTPELFETTKALFQYRWDRIIDTPMDYTRNKGASNQAWIRVAQYIGGVYGVNYFKLLIHTLEEEKDPVSYDPLTYYPLTHFILSEDGKELINLNNCVSQYLAKRTFYRPVSTQIVEDKNPIPLTEKENRRLQYSQPCFTDYADRFASKQKVKTLYKGTVDALKALVNGTLNPGATHSAKPLAIEQQEKAEQAYDTFLAFVTALPEDERSRLYNHPIIYNAEFLYFSELMYRVQYETHLDSGCIAVNAKAIAQLVCDYDDKAVFNQGIENAHPAEVNVAQMRRDSAKRLYTIDKDEAIRRFMVIIVSLMTRPFQCLTWSEKKQYWEGYENSVTSTGVDLFNTLMPLIETAFAGKTEEDIRSDYFALMKDIGAALEKTSWTRYKGTKSWLTAISDYSLFLPQDCTCFEPCILITCLSTLKIEDEQVKVVIKKFLEKAKKIMSGLANDYVKWVQVNIEFALLLNKTFNEEEILAAVRTAPPLVDVELLITKLWLMAQGERVIRALFKRLIRVLAEEATDDLKRCEVNIELNRFLEDTNIDSEKRRMVYNALNSSVSTYSTKSAVQAIMHYFFWQFALKKQETSQSFFGYIPGKKVSYDSEIASYLQNKYHQEILDIEKKLDGIQAICEIIALFRQIEKTSTLPVSIETQGNLQTFEFSPLPTVVRCLQ